MPNTTSLIISLTLLASTIHAIQSTMCRIPGMGREPASMLPRLRLLTGRTEWRKVASFFKQVSSSLQKGAERRNIAKVPRWPNPHGLAVVLQPSIEVSYVGIPTMSQSVWDNETVPEIGVYRDDGWIHDPGCWNNRGPDSCHSLQLQQQWPLI